MAYTQLQFLKISIIHTLYRIELNIKIFITGFYHVKVLTHKNRDTIFSNMKKLIKPIYRFPH